MKRYFVLAYGVACYAVTLCVLLYAVGFMGNLWVPKSIDGQASDSLPVALLVDACLLAVFGLQHSVMARPAFKKMVATFCP